MALEVAEARVAELLRSFSRVWQAFSTKKRARMLRLLIERTVDDGNAGQMRIDRAGSRPREFCGARSPDRRERIRQPLGALACAAALPPAGAPRRARARRTGPRSRSPS